VLFIILAALPTVFSQEEVGEYQIIVNIYVAESGKALIAGYISEDALASLPFLKDSSYVYYNDSSQIYAITDALTTKQGRDWALNFSLPGYYLDYTCYIYLPPGAEITDFSIPEDFSYTLRVENSSIVLGIEGFQAASPEILVHYRQAIEEVTKPPSKHYWIIPVFLALAAAVAAAILVIGRRREKPEAPQEKGIKITPEMKKVIETLSDREKAVVMVLIEEGGSATQAKIRRETGIAKSSLSGIINALARKNIINKREYGRTNLIKLSKWFLSETEVK
jgi:uncharacterized membrane protein